ncbi:MAG: hypothetical protein IRY97_08985, partial [Thermomicrobiaceae bacterium]|nr:hypothetical protein [Thermomicrobiaceae bacterium]
MGDVREALARLRRTLAGWTPEGRLALLAADLRDVREIPPGGVVRLLGDDPEERRAQARAVREALGPGVAVLGPGASTTVFSHEWAARWEVDRALEALRERVLPRLRPGEPAEVTLLVSEPPAVRRRVEAAARRALAEAGLPVDACAVHALDAYKAGLCWLREVVLPRWSRLPGIDRVALRYRPLVAEGEAPTLDLRIRWLQELFPADEVIAAALGLPLARVALEEWDGEASYAAEAHDADGEVVAREEFSPLWYVRPYLEPYPDAGVVHVTTGGVVARQGRLTVVERVPTDLDAFWDYYQGEVLPRLGQFIVEEGDGSPRASDQPFFAELRVEVTASESDEPLGLREERLSAAEALHEDLYFNALDFVEALGERHGGERLSAPGAVVPVVRVRPGLAPHARVTLRARARSVAQLEL